MDSNTPDTIETPSGKDAVYENFPVGSWLLPRRTRVHVAVFYRFARAADDIADTPDLTPAEKVERLEGFEMALLGTDADNPAYQTSHRMRRSLAETGIKPDHCVHLLRAFRQDATRQRYETWADLLAYCRLSAAPVGRYLLDLHGGSKDGYGPSDALCIALQIINHLQDCKEDYRTLDRVYLPLTWIHRAKARIEDLDRETTTPELAGVFEQALWEVDALLETAAKLPAGLASRRLAMEAAAIIRIAKALTSRLGSRDILRRRVELSKAGYFAHCVNGALSQLIRSA